MNPLCPVSVVVPSYRRGAQIKKTLDSIANQTLQPREVIVVNDGGFEETKAFVNLHYPWVRLIDIPHRGAAAARNAGVAVAASRWVALIDDDDEFRPEGLAVLYQALSTFPEAKSAHGDNSYTNLSSGLHYPRNYEDVPTLRERLSRVAAVRRVGRVALYDRQLFYALLDGNFVQQPWIFERAAYLELGGFQPGLVSADDWDIYMRFARRFPVAITTDLVGHQYTEPGRPHLTLDPRQREGQMEAARRHLRLAGLCDLRASVKLRQVLGGHHKALGDLSRTEQTRLAGKHYLLSLWYWPFDILVVIRSLVVIPLEMLAGFSFARQAKRD